MDEDKIVEGLESIRDDLEDIVNKQSAEDKTESVKTTTVPLQNICPLSKNSRGNFSLVFFWIAMVLVYGASLALPSVLTYLNPPDPMPLPGFLLDVKFWQILGFSCLCLSIVLLSSKRK